MMPIDVFLSTPLALTGSLDLELEETPVSACAQGVSLVVEIDECGTATAETVHEDVEIELSIASLSPGSC